MSSKNLDAYFLSLRQEFPILSQKVHGTKNLIYFDNGASSQKPKSVIESMVDFYSNYNSNVHRCMHSLGIKADEAYEQARETIASFFGVTRDEIVFTSGTTHAINLVAQGIKHKLKSGDEIILSEIEHHANLVVWQELAKEKNLSLKFVKLTEDFSLDMDHFERLCSPKTKFISLTAMSNVTGVRFPLEEVCAKAKELGAYSLIDGAQIAVHEALNLSSISCDFFVTSAHKLCGPTGIGMLYGKKKALQALVPSSFGGDMISQVDYLSSSYQQPPFCFEAGTPNIAGALGFAKALNFLTSVGMKTIALQEQELTKYMLEKLSSLNFVTLIGPTTFKQRAPVFSFIIPGLSPQDIAMLLDQEGIAVRAGKHCVEPFHNKMNLSGTARASLLFYNTKEEIDIFIKALTSLKMFTKE